MGVAIEVGLKENAFLGDAPETAQAENLETAGIGEDRARPRHEAMEAAQFVDQFVTGAEEQVVGIAEDDGRAEVVPKVALAESFDGRLGADGHENGRGDVAMGGMEDARAGARDGALGEEFEGDLAGQTRLYCGRLCVWPLRSTALSRPL